MCCWLRRPRPQKCRAGVAVRVSPPTSVVSFQSSSRSRSAGTPQRSRWAPTPSGTAKTVSVTGQGLDRGQVEVVVVVVRDHDDVDRAEGGERQGHGVQPLGPGEGERGAALAPDRVEEHPAAVDLGEHAGVPHPGQAQPGGRRMLQVLQRGGVQRHLADRRPAGTLPPSGSRSWRTRPWSHRTASSGAPTGFWKMPSAKFGERRIRSIRSPAGSAPNAAGRSARSRDLSVWGEPAPVTAPPDVGVFPLCARGVSVGEGDPQTRKQRVRSCSGLAVGALDAQPHHQTPVADHGVPVVVPVRVLALDVAVEADQLLDCVVVGDRPRPRTAPRCPRPPSTPIGRGS